MSHLQRSEKNHFDQKTICSVVQKSYSLNKLTNLNAQSRIEILWKLQTPLDRLTTSTSRKKSSGWCLFRGDVLFAPIIKCTRRVITSAGRRRPRVVLVIAPKPRTSSARQRRRYRRTISQNNYYCHHAICCYSKAKIDTSLLRRFATQNLELCLGASSRIREKFTIRSQIVWNNERVRGQGWRLDGGGAGTRCEVTEGVIASPRKWNYSNSEILTIGFEKVGQKKQKQF